MLALIQRVTSASVEVEGSVVGAIDDGLLALVGMEHGDTEAMFTSPRHERTSDYVNGRFG